MGDRMGVRLLGRFEVQVGNTTASENAFERRHAASLIKLLALNGGRMHREQVIDALWPEATLDEAAPRLHKAASYARRAVGDRDVLVLRSDSVMLWPDVDVDIDAVQFERLADRAVSGGEADLDAALALYEGDLLPEDPYEDWLAVHRDRLRQRYLDLLRRGERWEVLLDEDPADEEAHLALMKGFVADGQRMQTLRQFERLERALNEELGVAPSDKATALRLQVLEEREETPVSRVTLIDRSHERDLMGRALDDAARGSGSLLLLTGPAGIGKTSLAEWLLEQADREGFLTCRSVAASVDGPWPYAPVLEALGDLLRRAPELLEALPETHRDELLRVRGAPGTSHVVPADEDGHQRLYVAVDELIRSASSSRGLVVFIDDLHAADDASLALLHYVARQAGRERLLIVATGRPRADGDGLVALRGLVGRHGAREVRVGPFEHDHAVELVTSLTSDEPDEASLEEILELSGGSPFYLEELTRSLRSGSLDSRNEHRASIVSASLAGLDADVREVLTRVAIAGNRIDTDEFIALSGEDEDTAFDLLDRALSAEVLEHTAGGYRFRHGLVRESLLDELAPHRRRVVNRDAAHRFEAMGAPPARIAHHLLAAHEPREAAPWALLAAQAAQSVGALSDALALADAVVESSEGQTHLDLLAIRADVMAAMGDPGAIAAYRLALAETEGPTRRLLRAKMARAAMMSGDIDSAADALDGLEPDGGPFDGPILHARGMLAYMTGDLDGAEAAAEDARKSALDDQAPSGLLDVLTLQGMVAHNKGEWFERMRRELTTTADSKELAATVFDCHL